MIKNIKQQQQEVFPINDDKLKYTIIIEVYENVVKSNIQYPSIDGTEPMPVSLQEVIGTLEYQKIVFITRQMNIVQDWVKIRNKMQENETEISNKK